MVRCTRIGILLRRRLLSDQDPPLRIDEKADAGTWVWKP